MTCCIYHHWQNMSHTTGERQNASTIQELVGPTRSEPQAHLVTHEHPGSRRTSLACEKFRGHLCLYPSLTRADKKTKSIGKVKRASLNPRLYPNIPNTNSFNRGATAIHTEPRAIFQQDYQPHCCIPRFYATTIPTSDLDTSTFNQPFLYIKMSGIMRHNIQTNC